MLKELLSERGLPKLLSREEMLGVLLKEEYGYLLPKPKKLSWEVSSPTLFGNGAAEVKRVTLRCEWDGAEFSFPIALTLPVSRGKHPLFIMPNFRPDLPDKYLPAEKIARRDCAVLSFCHTDVTSDDGDFTNGLAGVLFPDGRRDGSDAGKLALWAWAAQRALDFAE